MKLKAYWRKDLFNSLGENNDSRKYEDAEQSFVYDENKSEGNIIWSFGKVHFILEKEVELFRECFKIIIDNRNEE